MSKSPYDWAVVGSGPAGIAAVGKLLDKGVDPDRLLWIDPHFEVGDLGHFWRNVSSNTTVQLFLNFLNDVDSFQYKKAKIDFELNHLPLQETCILAHMVAPLQWVTDRLKKIVHTQSGLVHEIKLNHRLWSLKTDGLVSEAKYVILATGAVPDSLKYPEIETVPFDIAMDKMRLKQYVDLNETYAVFGASHSAVICLQYLVEFGVKKVINFYRSPCRYAINLGDWILFDNTGLKGQTAAWARANIDGVLPANLERHTITEANIARYLPECDKAIYAVGFSRRSNLTIDHYEHLDHNPHVGIIAPGLFGFGIAYPEMKEDRFGNKEMQVGLWKFMNYLNQVLPLWFKYST